MAHSYRHWRLLLIGLAAAVSAGCVSTSAPSLSAGATTPSTDAGASTPWTVPPDDATMVDEVLQLVNLERTRNGLEPITLDPLLTQVAEDHAAEMIEESFFDHVNPHTGVGPGQRLTEVGYAFHSMGENLAAGQPTAREAVADWMASSGHRENILAPQWRRTGIAVLSGGPYRMIWVEEFADPLLTQRAPSFVTRLDP